MKSKRQKKAAVLVCDDDLSQSGSDSNTASSSTRKIKLKIRCKRKAVTKMKMKATTISAKGKTAPVKVTVPPMEKAIIVSGEESTTELESEESTSEYESESDEITGSGNKSKEKPKTASKKQPRTDKKKQDEKLLIEEQFGWKLGTRAFDTRSPSQCHLRPRLVEFDTITTDEFAYFLHFFPYVI